MSKANLNGIQDLDDAGVTQRSELLDGIPCEGKSGFVGRDVQGKDATV